MLHLVNPNNAGLFEGSYFWRRVIVEGGEEYRI